MRLYIYLYNYLIASSINPTAFFSLITTLLKKVFKAKAKIFVVRLDLLLMIIGKI